MVYESEFYKLTIRHRTLREVQVSKGKDLLKNTKQTTVYSFTEASFV